MIRSIELDTTADRFAGELARQMPFIISTALNRAGEYGNAALRQHLPQAFTIRQPGLLRHVAPYQIPTPNRATKTNLSVILETEAIGRIFNPFQTGDPKVSHDPLNPVAIPTQELRWTKQTIIPRAMYPTNLGLVARRDPTGALYYAQGVGSRSKRKSPFRQTANGVLQIKGKRRTFVLDPVHHRGLKPSQWGVYQRTGPKDWDVQMIWRFTRRVQRPASLDFYDVAAAGFDRNIEREFNFAVDLAIRTTR